MSNDIHLDMIQPRGPGYRDSQIVAWSHYQEPIDRSEGRLAGNSRRAGDASADVQSRVIDALIESSQEAGLSTRETAYVLAIARHESGFNPDAAAGTTSAAGIGQFIDGTGRRYGINDSNRFDTQAQADALVAHFIENRDRAQRRNQGEAYIYKYHHDGPTQEHGGLDIAQQHVLPYLDRYEQFVSQRLGQSIDPVAGPPSGATLASDQAAHLQDGRDPMADGLLRLDERGTPVRELQETLNRLGHTDAQGRALETDGRFGPRTEQAVEAFQRAHGLEVDGIVGPETRKALERAQQQERPQDAGARQPGTGAERDGLNALMDAAKRGDVAAMRAAMTDFAASPQGREWLQQGENPCQVQPSRQSDAQVQQQAQEGVAR